MCSVLSCRHCCCIIHLIFSLQLKDWMTSKAPEQQKINSRGYKLCTKIPSCNKCPSMSNVHELIRVVNGILRVVKQWFTSRTDSELHIISETARSDLTTRTSGETMVGESPNTLNTMYNRRSKNVRVQKLKTQCIFFVLKTWEPKHAKHRAQCILFVLKTWELNHTNTAQCIFVVLKTWEPKHSVKNYVYSSF